MLYDDQAASFDERAGVPLEASRTIALALGGITGIHPGETLLEIGAGTGSLSMALLDMGMRYIGFDRSGAMLAVFSRRVEEAGFEAELLVADGNERWPVQDQSVAVIFAARAMHHLLPEHMVAETWRCIRPEGGWLVLGQIRRPPDSVKAVLRHKMRELLREHGVDGRSRQQRTEKVFAALRDAGSIHMENHVAARWKVSHSPADSLNAWDEKRGLAGIDAPADMKTQVLADLRAWAVEHYGDLDRPLEQEETFELTAIQIPGQASPSGPRRPGTKASS